jgi:putative Holliday junction resolvase
MPVTPDDGFRRLGTVLGFDFGTHKIGVAVGQTLTGTANPLTTLTNIRLKPDWNSIAQLIAEWRPEVLVVGLPMALTDAEADMAPRARRFARQLEGRFRLSVHMADERLTTREARRQLGKAAHLDPTRVDAVAAQLILETWLEQQG